jgi:class 3 adenylate cyclase
VADVVGYSKLMGSDEAGTLAQLEGLRAKIIEPQISKHSGRLFKAVGDGFLIEFTSAVQAVNCAKAIPRLDRAEQRSWRARHRLVAIERSERHPAAVDRLTGARSVPVNYSGRELRAARSMVAASIGRCF